MSIRNKSFFDLILGYMQPNVIIKADKTAISIHTIQPMHSWIFVFIVSYARSYVCLLIQCPCVLGLFRQKLLLWQVCFYLELQRYLITDLANCLNIFRMIACNLCIALHTSAIRARCFVAFGLGTFNFVHYLTICVSICVSVCHFP